MEPPEREIEKAKKRSWKDRYLEGGRNRARIINISSLEEEYVYAI